MDERDGSRQIFRIGTVYYAEVRPVTHAQTWASYSALYRFGRLSRQCTIC